MLNYLVVVESPAKAKTIEKYLNSNKGDVYKVLASYGHVRDLPSKTGSVVPENNFELKYSLIEKNTKHVDAICKAIKKADGLLLATDPDREGEAISWHIQQILEEKGLLKNKSVSRIVFNEITKSAIAYAIEHPRGLSIELIDAQQARRALDYLVGFTLSPLLWKKVRRGLSAGRVQSPALRMIVEREDEIINFIPKEYWKVIAACEFNNINFGAKLSFAKNQKIEQFTVNNQIDAEKLQKEIINAADGKLRVLEVEKKQRKRKPAPPFITSTLQQEASRKCYFTAKKTMSIAQNLYEGIDIGNGTVGLITYMRTDSVHVSLDAANQIKAFIKENYGQNFVDSSGREFKTKSKNAQEAHEAIRPTDISLTPDTIKQFLSPEQLKLYTLIWQRTLASFMADAILNTVSVDLIAEINEKYIFRANGSTIAFQGFLVLYEEGKDDNEAEEQDKRLPELSVNDIVDLNQVNITQHFTEPPPRFSEATLVKALEEYDIGRPSTYATIIHTLQDREYVHIEQKRFKPTDVGVIVSKFLTQHFPQYVDYQFTAKMENNLDQISRGELQWIPEIRNFWLPFKKIVEDVSSNVKRAEVTSEEIDKNCPKCDSKLMIRLGKRGRFIGCSAYPNCDFTENLSTVEGGSDTPNENEVFVGRKCSECDSDLLIKSGRYGKFLGCSKYPECTHIEPIEKPEDSGVSCPSCNNGTLIKRKSRRGKYFYSCKSYPKCKYAIWNEPIFKACPKCKWPILTKKETKRHGVQILCPHDGCDYVENS